MKRLCVPAVLLLLAGPAGAQTFSEATDVVVVEVPVQVLRDGEPVRGLTAQDFEVYEGRKKLPVTGFEMLDLNAGTAEEGWKSARPVSTRRHFLLLFDLAFSSPRALAQGQEAARDMLEGLHPSDLVAVASYAPSIGPALLLGFTTDRQQARAALDLLGDPEMFGRVPDPLRLVLIGNAEMGQAGAGGGDGGAYGGSMGGYGAKGEDRKAMVKAALAQAEGEAGGGGGHFESAERDARKRAVTDMARAFEDLAKTVGGLYGRKYVVFFSEGFDASILGGTADVDEQNHMAEMAATSAVGAVAGVDSEKRFGSTEAANDLERMLRELRRADCVIQAVDTGGLRERGGPENQWAGGRDSLFLLADGTGGELYENYNDLSAAMAQMLLRTSVTYVLALQPEGLKRDGSYHEIRVELKGSPKGTRVVHRPGYYAPRPFEQQSPTERILQTARNVMGGRETGTIGTEVLAAPFHQGGGHAYVPVIVEVDGPSLMAGTEGWALPVEIYAYAFDAQGQARDFFSQTVGLELLKVGSALQKTGLKFFGHLDLPPGDWAVRVLVRNAATGAAGMKSVDVRVPELDKPSLLPAFFPEPPGKWLLVRESRPSAQAAYPFMSGEEAYIPASLPELAPGREAAVSLVAYHLPAGEVRAEARIRTQDGREAGTGRLRIVQRHVAGDDGAERLTAAFEPPAGLQAGEYLLLVTLTGPGGDAQSSVVSAASFEVPAGGAS